MAKAKKTRAEETAEKIKEEEKTLEPGAAPSSEVTDEPVPEFEEYVGGLEELLEKKDPKQMVNAFGKIIIMLAREIRKKADK